MSFFKDFKDDLSLAVNELLPGEDFEMEEELEESPEMMVNTLDGDLDIESELSKLDGLLERVDKKEPVRHVQIEPEEPVLEKTPEPKQAQAARPQAASKEQQAAKPQQQAAKPQQQAAKPQQQAARQQAAPKPQQKAEPPQAVRKEESIQAALSRFDTILEPEKKEDDDLPFDFDTLLKEADQKPQRVQQRPQARPQQHAQPKSQAAEPKAPGALHGHDQKKPSISIKEELPMNEELTKETAVTMDDDLSTESLEVTDEVSIITTGTTIKGNLSTTGSFSIRGRVEGNVQCNGKLEVTGTIKGNSSSSEVFSDAAKIEGEIMSTGTVKIGLGSVVVGNIAATSAVIAGAVKGDIDVQGPVVVDTSAVIVGNIKSRSVQINNGAVIEGFCSQCYADIDVESLFGDKKGK